MEGERRELQHALEMVKENAERQVRELEQENVQLSNTIEVTSNITPHSNSGNKMKRFTKKIKME